MRGGHVASRFVLCVFSKVVVSVVGEVVFLVLSESLHRRFGKFC